MLAAAFLSWVRSSGSCITSSRKPITLHLSSSLVSKSCGEEVCIWSRLRPEEEAVAPESARGGCPASLPSHWLGQTPGGLETLCKGTG